MSKGTAGMVGWLATATFVIVVGFAVAIVLTRIAPADHGHRPDTLHELYQTLINVTGFYAYDTFGWWWAFVQFLIALGGLFIASTLIGIIVTGFNAKVEELRKGRSFVVESGHTLILGWSEAIYTIISELAISREREGDAAVVILADDDKVEMEERLASKLGKLGKLRIVCRSGSPSDLADLAIVNPDRAKSIIVLSGESENPDIKVIKSILALTHNPARLNDRFHIVAEIEETKNRIAAGVRIVTGAENSPALR